MTRASARIFVQIPSYRDRECQWTIRDAFAKASHPERIFVGVCWQFDPDADHDCFEIETRPAQVRRIDFHANEAKGLGWARAQAQSLWRGEEYTLQIDSHMRFAPGWDVTLLDELARCPSDWPVLTIYPPAYWPPDRLETGSDPFRAVQRVRGFSPNGILQFTVDWVPAAAPVDGPKITAALAGGFVFGSSRIIADVPSDPEIYFEGEEPNLAARLWTSGFDLFSPTAPVVYHYYRRADSRRPWDDANPTEPNARSLQRMRQLLQPEPGDAERLGRHGLGTARSLAAYELFAGVDFRAQSVAAYALHYPFVFTSEMAAALAEDLPCAPADGSGALFLDGAALLFSPHRRALFHLAPGSALIWSAIEEGHGRDALVALAAERSGLAPQEAMDRVNVQLCHWAGMGLLRDTAPLRDPGASTSPQIVRRATRPAAGQLAVKTDRLLLGRRLRVTCWHHGDAALLAPILSCLPAARGDDAPLHRLEVTRIGPYRHVVRDQLFPPATVGDESQLAAIFLQALEAAGAATPDALQHLRGFVTEDDAGPSLLIGDVAWLAAFAARLEARPLGATGGDAGRIAAAEPVLNGLMRIQVDRQGRVQPVPSPLPVPHALYERHRAVLDLPVASRVHHGLPYGPVVFPSFAEPAPTRSLRASRLIVVSPGGSTALVRLDRSAAMRAVMHAALPEPRLASIADAAALVDWVESLGCYRLAAGDLDDALALLRA